MTDTLTPFDIAATLPDVVTEWQPLPSNAACVLTGAPGGETIIIHDYYEGHPARPLMCNRHGIQRHDWNGKRFVCKVCGK